MKLTNVAVLRDDDRTSPLPMFPLDDFEDDVSTSLDIEILRKEQSYVGTRPQQDEEPIDVAVRTRHEALAAAVAALETTCASFDSVDVSASAAQTSLRRRVGSVRVLVTALEGVASHVETTNHDLFAGDGLLAPYLAGIYLWATDVTETLSSLARDLNTLTPDWASFRARLGDVAWIFEMAASEGRRLEGVLDLVPTELHDHMDELLVAFVGLKHKLDEPFG
jgi:hypothetical protein